MSFIKIKKIKQQSGFTIIELIIVIVIIAILATISSLSYEKILGNVRNSQRASNAKVLAEALEKYYDQNGEYPGCATMTNSDLSVVTSALKGLNAKVLTAPLADSGTNSLTCADISDNEDDVLLYSKDKRASCLTGNSCGSFSLEYHDELNSTSIIKVASRRNAITGGSYAISISNGTYIGQMYSSALLKDGSYISTGTTSTDIGGLDILLVKHNSTGDIIWSKAWGGSSDEQGVSVISSSDGGFVVAGSTYTMVDGDIASFDGFLSKFTTNGDLSWSRTLGTSEEWLTDLINYAAETSDGGYVVAGGSNISIKNEDAFIAKIDSSGTLLWSNTFGGDSNDEAHSVIETSDGKFVLVGETDSLSDNITHSFLAVYDSSGGYLTNTTWAGDSRDYAFGVTQLTDGSIVVVGCTRSFGSGSVDVSITRYSLDGSIISNKVWGAGQDDRAYRIIDTSDGGYLIVGLTESFDSYAEGLYLKFNSSDSLEFAKTWGNGTDDFLAGVTQDTDQGYFISGRTTPLNSMPAPLILKTTDSGTINSCSTTMCKSVTGTLMDVESTAPEFSPTVDAAGMSMNDVTWTEHSISPVITKIVYK